MIAHPSPTPAHLRSSQRAQRAALSSPERSARTAKSIGRVVTAPDPVVPEGILSTIGSTPLIRLSRILRDTPVDVYAKLEFLNPGGSIKDRPASHIVQRALERGELQRGDHVVESSSGNMAIGLAQICRYHGLHLTVVVDPAVNQQTVRIVKAYGGTVEKVDQPVADGGFLGARLRRVRELVETGCTEDGRRTFWPNQYQNPDNPDAHHATVQEIIDQLGHAPDYLFIATSTCGTLMGCARQLKDCGHSTRLIAVDALGSVIFGNSSGDRKIPGHGAGCRSHFLDRSVVHQVAYVSDRDCVAGCRRLLDEEAILAGGSSGGVVTAAHRLFSDLERLDGAEPGPAPARRTAALLFCDRGERYLDTIYDDQWLAENLNQ